jgi:tetratricopeptide (TPR) repeat protein
MRNRYRQLKGKPGLVYVEGRIFEGLPAMPDKPVYDQLAALNVVDAVRAVTADFYQRLGLDAQNAPVMKLLERARDELFADLDVESARSQGSVLVRFEAAWNLFQNGKTAAAREEFEALLSDEALLRRAGQSVYLREVVIRSTEIVGRDAELAGDTEKALRLYERVMTMGGRGVIARRLALLLWRAGRIREAAVWAEKAVWSDHNLAAHAAKDNAYLTRVAEILAATGAKAQRGQG